MRDGQLVFAQVMQHLPLKAFSRMVERHRAQHKVKEFTCLDQFLALSFAQLTWRESLRDIEINLRAQAKHLYRMGFRCKTISRNTLANANGTRPWALFADLAQHLIGIARPLYANDPLGGELKALMGATVYALDSTTIDLCLSLFAWAPFRATKAGIKLHTLIDLRGSIPSFIHISNGKMADVRVLDLLVAQSLIEAGAYYVMDRAFVDFKRLNQLHSARAFFVTRAKQNLVFETVRRKAVNTFVGLISDHQIRLTGAVSAKRYPDILRRVVFFDEDTGKTLEFLTNNLLTVNDHLRYLQTALAGRVVLQVDQAAFTHQGVLRHQRECRQDANLDRDFDLCADRHHQKAFATRPFLARNPARIESELVCIRLHPRTA